MLTFDRQAAHYTVLVHQVLWPFSDCIMQSLHYDPAILPGGSILDA
jgi:hypothetical protein